MPSMLQFTILSYYTISINSWQEVDKILLVICGLILQRDSLFDLRGLGYGSGFGGKGIESERLRGIGRQYIRPSDGAGARPGAPRLLDMPLSMRDGKERAGAASSLRAHKELRLPGAQGKGGPGAESGGTAVRTSDGAGAHAEAVEGFRSLAVQVRLWK